MVVSALTTRNWSGYGIGLFRAAGKSCQELATLLRSRRRECVLYWPFPEFHAPVFIYKPLFFRIRIPGSALLTKIRIRNRIRLLLSLILRMQKFFFFFYNLPTGTSSSVLKKYFFAKIIVLKCYFGGFLFQSAQHIYKKREGSGSIPLTNGSGSGRPKNMRIRFRFRIWIPNTALYITSFKQNDCLQS